MTGRIGAPTRIWPESARPAPFDGPVPDGMLDPAAEFVVEWQVAEGPGLGARREGAPRN